MNQAATTFEKISANDHEVVLFCVNKAVGLKGFIALHNRVLGPALGGVRIREYATEDAALADILNLSQAMTLKSSLAEANLGGGKSSIILQPGQQKSPELVKAFAKHIDLLAGKYIACGDYGSTVDDLHLIKQVTPFVSGTEFGDSGVMTALGVFRGVEASVAHLTGDKANLKEMHVGVQGVGKVGARLVKHLLGAGCTVTVADAYLPAVEKLKAEFPAINTVSVEELFELPVDILSPNATGGVVTERFAQTTQAKIVAGGSNNILENTAAGHILFERGILYAPDFAINCGGILILAAEWEGRTVADAEADTNKVYPRMLEIFKRAGAEKQPPEVVATAMAMERIEKAKTS